MKRQDFLKSLIAGPAVIASTVNKPEIPVIKPEMTAATVYSFDEIFTVWPTNDRLIYPKADSEVYKILRTCFADRIVNSTSCVYSPFRHTYLPVKEQYTIEDFSPVKFCLETDRYQRDAVTENGEGELNKVAFRFTRETPEKMHLVVFLAYNSWNRPKN